MIDRLRAYLATIITPSIFATLFSGGLTSDSRMYTFVTVYVAIFLFTLPVYIHLNKLDGLKLIPIMFGTFMVGVFAGVILVLFGGGAENYTYDSTIIVKDGWYTLAGVWFEFLNVLFFGFLGASIGFFWWLIAIAGKKTTNKKDDESSPPDRA